MSNIAKTLAAVAIGTTLASPALAGKTVELSKGSVIEIAYLDLKHGTGETFFKDYFAKVEPIIKDHGGRVVAKFTTIGVEEGNITPQYLLLFEWPSIDAFDAAVKDERAKPYIPIRDQVLRNFHFGMFTIEKDASFTLEPGVVYEFFAGNPGTPNAPELLGQFFQQVIPTAMEYGRGALLDLKPVDYAGDNYDRMIAGVATWPSAAHFYQFTNTDVFRDGIEKYRNPALAEQEIINTYYIAE